MQHVKEFLKYANERIRSRQNRESEIYFSKLKKKTRQILNKKKANSTVISSRKFIVVLVGENKICNSRKK